MRERLPYLRELGVSYLHLMPLLHARPEPNDGGYAVLDYGAVEPALGTMDDLRALAADLRAAGMALCVDVVLNHTAQEHPWARAALAGDAGKLRLLPHVPRPRGARRLRGHAARGLPGHRAGQLHLGARSSTAGCGRRSTPTSGTSTTRTPRSSGSMAEVMLGLAAAGVDVLRLDAVPFMWKRVGTNSQNQPEVHELLQAFRSLMRIAAPAVAFKAEAIVSPRDLVTYLGADRHEGKECELAYHNVLMVLLWSALASKRVVLLTSILRAHAAACPRARAG